jgi:hypothetical protein
MSQAFAIQILTLGQLQQTVEYTKHSVEGRQTATKLWCLAELIDFRQEREELLNFGHMTSFRIDAAARKIATDLKAEGWIYLNEPLRRTSLSCIKGKFAALITIKLTTKL